MRISFAAALRRRTVATAIAATLLSAGASAVVAENLAPSSQPAMPAPAAVPAPQTADATGKPLSTEARIVIVEWKIKKGHEQEFLDYWATKSTIPDRTGLIAEFMSSEESREQFPWINWAAAESGDFTTFYNIGIWRKADDFMGQIGKYIDNKRPPMAFEADHRHRVFLAPVKWRIGMASLPGKDAEGVK
ncbi:hypothetical protein [Lichenibacterium ramalinae]|jgi:hypothetical protein|uniref:Uncharacterized protein n=1 Tax=Lichenibacterium ramalinae TaxID=2316527 RepID=A0A4Q2RH85_9HYPH|nr:hypothetical protein [Lichenibacterium ramalinae]RYB07074.1 hypothetical protein D3272_03070 [Lichenibacterium ramalinae]